MVWPFTRKRRSNPMLQDDATSPLQSERSQNNAQVRRPSKRSNTGPERRISPSNEKATEAQLTESQPRQKQARSPKKVNIDRRGSIENITALPISQKLQQSPHLRATDPDLARIPYTFRDHATSQTSFQRVSRPNTLKSKRSTYETPQRRRSSKKRKDGDRLREEEIRAMSAPTSISKRPGDGLMRRDSRKRRNLTSMKDSTVSLPPEESIHSTMSGNAEQRGWEVGSLAIFNPRPAIRLSGIPQYASPSSYLSQMPESRDGAKRARDKRPATRESGRKRIGDEADDLDAGDIRILLERDAKRRERRKKEQQEKLDRKLRARAGRERGDSDRRRREVEEAVREQEKRQKIEDELRSRDFTAVPMPVHPALRDEPVFGADEPVGLGIAAAPLTAIDPHNEHERALPTTEELGTENTGTYLDYQAPNEAAQNPFADPLPSPAPEPESNPTYLDMPGAFTPVQTPMEDPVLETARAVRLSHAGTPPLSPVDSRKATPSMSQLSNEVRSERTISLPEPPVLPAASAERRTSDTTKERRAGAWATFFRRGGTNLKKTDEAQPAGGTSFSNTSRDSMSRGPIPAHLLGNEPSPFQRRRSGTPTRTQSKFREDLPEMPMSPPDSRVQSPEVPDMPVGAAAIAAARKEQMSSKPVYVPDVKSRDSFPDAASGSRFDTPTSPTARAHLMSASMASVDSEGSWLASGGSVKRASIQSALSRDLGSLSKRKPEFTASYEELGGDRDAEYVRRTMPSPDASRAMAGRRISNQALIGADEESVYSENPSPSPGPTTGGDPMTVHDSVRRKPTLIHRDPIARSREGLLTEYASGETATLENEDISEPDSPVGEPEVRRATSVLYSSGKGGHARQVSAGSARLLDLPPSRRHSLSPNALDRHSLIDANASKPA